MSNIIYVGSGADCQIRIDGNGIAIHHAALYLDEGFVCLDLFPRCSAKVNGNNVEGKFWLQQNDVIIVGNSRLNLNAIKEVLTSSHQSNYDTQLVFDRETFDDDSDAVIIKRNPWPFIIVAIIIIAAGTLLCRRVINNHVHKEKMRQEIHMKQDTILQMRIKVDSLNDWIKQLQSE